MSNTLQKSGGPLPWRRAAAGAVLSLAVILPLAVAFNLAIGRTIHWDIVAVLAGAGFVGLTFALRYLR